MQMTQKVCANDECVPVYSYKKDDTELMKALVVCEVGKASVS